MPNLLNMPVKYCTDENDNEFSPVVYQESMFNDDGTRMNPVPRKMFAKAYDPTKTYPTENLFCIQDNKYYKFTGSGTTTGTFDSTKWTETDDATELTQLNNTLAGLQNSTVKYQYYTVNGNATKSFSTSPGAYALIITIGAAAARCTIASILRSGDTVYVNTLIPSSNISYSGGTTSFTISNTSAASTKIEILVFEGEIVSN